MAIAKASNSDEGFFCGTKKSHLIRSLSQFTTVAMKEATNIKAIAMRTMAKVMVRMDLGQLLRT